MKKRSARPTALFLAIAGAAGVISNAHADWNVAVGDASTNGAWSGASPDVWTPSASGATVSATEIGTRLGAGTAVTIRTSGGGGAENGDITVSGAVGWSANELTLSAARNIAINANLNGSGTAKLYLQYGFGTGAGGYTLSNGARVNLPAGGNFSTQLDLTGLVAYTVITDLGGAASSNDGTLQGMVGTLGGKYALGADIDASTTNTWNANAGFTPVGTDATRFTGSFDGLGHTITGLTINSPGWNVPANFYKGLFGYSTGSLSNIGLLNSSIGGANIVGALAGRSDGAISNSYADGGGVSVSVHQAGGLVGQGTGSISNSYANVSVTGTDYACCGGGTSSSNIGGLVGGALAGSSISNSYATGSVSGGTYVGGLVGQNRANIDTSYASGAVTATTSRGGFIGDQLAGAITNSYWDSATTGVATSNRSGNIAGVTDVAAAPNAQASYAGFDFAGSWRIYEGQTRPLLKSFLTPLTVTANNATTTYSGAAYSGGNGVSYSTAPNANLLGTVSYGGTSQGAVNVGSYVITPAGLYSNQKGYDIAFANGSVTVVSPPDPPPPTLIVAGPGSTTTLTGTTPVTASPGSTIVIPTGANVVGVAITLAGPSGGGEAGPITFKIGSLTLTLSGYTPETVVSFRKVLVNGVETLVLTVTSGSLTLSGSAGQPLMTLNGTATLTAGTDGTAVGFSANADGSGSIAVTAGHIVLSADAFALRKAGAPQRKTRRAALADGKIYAGELASFDADGKIVGVRLGAPLGETGGAGDALELNLAPNLLFATTVPKLDGTSTRLGRRLDEALAQAAGASLVGTQSDGVLALDIGGVRLYVLPLGEVEIDPEAVDGAKVGADGTVTVSIQGVSTRFAPSVADLGQLGRDVGGPFPWPQIEVGATGVLKASINGMGYILRPAWVVREDTDGTPGFTTGEQGGVTYRQNGRAYALQAAVADWTSFVAAVEEALPGATLQTNPDGSVTVTLSEGPSMLLTPVSELVPAPEGTQPWWVEADGSLRLRYVDGTTMQGFRVE